MTEIEIDGKKIQVEQGSMIIEAADRAGISIPRFCYHKKLSVAANCRMCLVEVEKMGKPVPSCATPVTDGMKIKTLSNKAKDAQKSVMEFLLINHPLDCPICDQGGECELQDVAMNYGKNVSRFNEGKRAVSDKDLGPLVASNMTRCIHCTRCVRFGQEIAGLRELGVTGRGEHTEIGTYVAHAMQSELSGNVIDVCPVGALTSKPYRYQARAWEMQQTPGVSPHDCIGSHLYVHARRNEVMRVVPRELNELNEMWISDRDRFSYCGLSHSDRLFFPLIKQNGLWRKSDWHNALQEVAEQLQKIVDQHGPNQIGGIISPNATTEEHYLFQKLLRSLGCNNVDHRLREQDVRDQQTLALAPTLKKSLPELRQQKVIFLIGSNVRHEQPVLGIRLLKATVRVGAKVLCLNPQDYDFQFPVHQKTVCHSDRIPHHLAAIVKCLAEITETSLPPQISAGLAQVKPTETDRAMAQQLVAGGDKVMIFLGAAAMQHRNASTLRSLAKSIERLIPAEVAFLNDGANPAGAWLAGAIPHREEGGKELATPGLSVAEQFADPRKAYVLFGVEPEMDCLNSGAALAALKSADYVVNLSSFVTETMRQYSQTVLPITAFSETEGTYINIKNSWETVPAAVTAPDEVKPGWKVLRVLGNLMHLNGFEYDSCQEIIGELKTAMPTTEFAKELAGIELQAPRQGLTRLTAWPLYAVDSLVRSFSAFTTNTAC